MSGALFAIENFFWPQPSESAVAAAVTVLSGNSVVPDLATAIRAVSPSMSVLELAAWKGALSAALSKGGLTAPRRMAAFLGQCAVESGGFRDLEEDLNYTAARLCEVWPSRFPTESEAATCAMRPEALANRVYADRLGNGDAESGDGWRFRGRGLIQLTGRSNYQLFADDLGLNLDQAVALAGTREGAAESAVWFWNAHALSPLADDWSIDLITRKINGGTAGAVERARLCDAALHALGAH